MSEPSWNDIEDGDEIVAEVRGKVVGRGSHGVRIGGLYVDGVSTLKSITKPVVTFKPGDVVRSTRNPDFVYTIGDGRYFSHRRATWYELRDATEFSPKFYELVP